MKRIKTGPKSKLTEIGAKFEDIMLNHYKTMEKFINDLSEELKDTSPDTIRSKISSFMNKGALYPFKYILPTEKLLHIRMADIIYQTNEYKAPKRGLYEIGTYGTYEDFDWLAKQTDGSTEVIRSADEWSKGIVDYVYEAKNLIGLKYLVDHGFYHVFVPGKPSAEGYYGKTDEEHALLLLKMLTKDPQKDPALKAEIFLKLFDSNEKTDMLINSPGIFKNEACLKVILKSETLLHVICTKLDEVPESVLNGPRRIAQKEYECICASHWLTPLLRYTLEHEDKYRDEAKMLMEASAEIAQRTWESIKNNIDILGGAGQSISTKHGLVILDHAHVIGIIGEPETSKNIEDEELRAMVNEVTAIIGSIRALAKYQTPTIIGDKMHLPRATDNPLYPKFINLAQGQPYLLQKADNRDGDSHNLVFNTPKGKEAHTLSLAQWAQVGKALRSIHQIGTGEEGKVFCHGRFAYPHIYVLDNSDVELIWGYKDVYIGDPEDDIMAMCHLAFAREHFGPAKKQAAIFSFLEGYGYPTEGILEKLFNYYVSQAKKQVVKGEIDFWMHSAQYALIAMNEQKESEQ